MTVSEVVIDLSDHNYDDLIELAPEIEYLTVPCETVIVQTPGAPEPPTGCVGTVKYEGNTVTLKATPRNGTGPYDVEFRKNGAAIASSRLAGLLNPIIDAPEDIEITRVYTLDNEDIRTASVSTIDFSVYISDSCPTGAKTCESICTVNIGCLAPVCNFTVT